MHAILLASILLFGIEQVDCSVNMIESCSIIDHLDAADDINGPDVDTDYSLLDYKNIQTTTMASGIVILLFAVYTPPLLRSIYRPPKT